jgi:hypothetical protein
MSEAPMGWVVLTLSHTTSTWQPDWDGYLHPTFSDGEIELAEARDAGHIACLAALFAADETARMTEDQMRLATGETCLPGQPAPCGDYHNAGRCVRPRESDTPSASEAAS